MARPVHRATVHTHATKDSASRAGDEFGVAGQKDVRTTMSNRARNDDDMSDASATPDSGGVIGGPDGTMENAADRGERSGGTMNVGGGLTARERGLARSDALAASASGAASGASSDPNTDSSHGIGGSVSYQPDPGTGAPTAQHDASTTSTSSTDQRGVAASGDPNQNLGKDWTGETASDADARDNPSQRGGQTATEATDAF